jgi:hypothetical protein
MFDKGIEIARTEIIFAFHADMVAGPDLDTNILKHLKPGVVVSATRIEPPLHPPGPEKVTEDFGVEADQFKKDEFISYCRKLSTLNKDKFTEGIFAPWCMYKSDYLAIGGHDELFAPQSKEDSDLFNRFVLNGYKVIQSWDSLVYHFTSRGSRFNKHAGGGAGKNSEEWLYTTNKNSRNFIRKWGHFVKHDTFMKPIIPHKYNVGFVVHNCNPHLLGVLEPWCDDIYVDCDFGSYVASEENESMFKITDKVHNIGDVMKNDVQILFDGSKLTNEHYTQFIKNIPFIVQQTDSIGSFEWDIFQLHILNLRTKDMVQPFFKNIF